MTVANLIAMIHLTTMTSLTAELYLDELGMCHHHFMEYPAWNQQFSQWHKCAGTCIHACINTHTHTCIYIHRHTYIHMYTHTYTYTCTHTAQCYIYDEINGDILKGLQHSVICSDEIGEREMTIFRLTFTVILHLHCLPTVDLW